MATQWQGPHFIVIIAAAGLAFAGGYAMGGRSRPLVTPPIAINMSNGVADPGGFPSADENGQMPRGRVDENELIARNAEPPEGSEAPQGAGNGSGTARPPAEERRPRPPREAQDDKPPPGDSVEEEPAFDPDDR